MANNILSGPIAGVGVERIFSIARQICSYQRIRLDAFNIMQLLIVRIHNKLMTHMDIDAKRSTTMLKKGMGISKVDYRIAEE
jgi:hypothetical protein